MIPFGMHAVVLDFVGANREESAEADVEGEGFDNHALGFEPSEEVVGHIETGGGSGGRAGLLGPDGLIAGLVAFGGGTVKVGRQGDGAILFGELVERGC